VLGKDSDVESSGLSAILLAGQAQGSLTLNAEDSFTDPPNANYNGSDSFTYQANDGSLDSNVATVSITVNAVNDVPVASNDSYSTIGRASCRVGADGVLGDATDVEYSALSGNLADGPAHGSLT